jgi:hypothetical protein
MKGDLMAKQDRDMTSPEEPGGRGDRSRPDDETIGRDRGDEIRGIADDEDEEELDDMDDLDEEADEEM